MKMPSEIVEIVNYLPEMASQNPHTFMTDKWIHKHPTGINQNYQTFWILKMKNQLNTFMPVAANDDDHISLMFSNFQKNK